MGRIFIEHPGGTKIFTCLNCGTPLTNKGELISTRFTGATGRAYLFNKVVNLTFSEVQDRVMQYSSDVRRNIEFIKSITGRHRVRDVACKYCGERLGWFYEYAVDESQKYKEGKVILEKALIGEENGIESEDHSVQN